MPRRSAPSLGCARDKLGKVNALSVAVGVSVLAHLAAIGALLTHRPVPLLAPSYETIEVSLVPEQALGSPRASSLSGAMSWDKSVNVPVKQLPALLRPDVTATASPPDRRGSVNAGDLFALPALPSFKPQAQSVAFDMLGTMLDCPAVEGSSRAASRPTRRLPSPCVSADLPVRFRVTMLPTNASESSGSEVRADDDYRTFKANPWVFNEGLFFELHAKF
jgi:hypothetical protein